MASADLSVDRLCISDECSSGSFRGAEKKTTMLMLGRRFAHRQPGKKKYVVTMADEEVRNTDRNSRLHYEEIVEETFGRGRVRLWDCVKNHFICFLSESEREILEGRKEVKKVEPPSDDCYVPYDKNKCRDFHLEVKGGVAPPIFKGRGFPLTMGYFVSEIISTPGSIVLRGSGLSVVSTVTVEEWFGSKGRDTTIFFGELWSIDWKILDAAICH